MSYTILIKKDGWESLLKIKIQDKVLEQEPDILSLIKDCFEKIFQYIKEKDRDEDTEIEDVDLSD